MKRAVERKDLLKFQFLANPAFSPDGGRVAYRVSSPNVEKNGYDSNIWVFDIDKGTNRKLTNSGAEKFFCWSLDGKSLIFASGREKTGGEKPKGKQTRFYAIDPTGGEAEELFTIPHAASAVWALDGERYLVTAVFEPEYENPENADFMIFEQVPFMANGKGYTGQQRTGLGVWNAKTGEFHRLTPEGMEVERCTLNSDRSEALIVGVEYKDIKPFPNAVYSLNLFTGAIQRLCEIPDFSFKHAARVGNDVVFTGAGRKNMGVHENPKFYLLQENSGDRVITCLTPDLDSSLSQAVGGDSHYGCSDLSGAFFPVEGAFGGGLREGGLVFCATSVMKSCLYELGRGGFVRKLTGRTSVVVDWNVAGGRAVYAAYEGLWLPELYLLDENGQEKRLTDFNRALFDDLSLSQPIHVTLDNGQGWTLDGWYMKPANFQEGKKYPAILNIHGGPKVAFGDIYHHEMQCWAAEGYVVVYCNPRGGDGRGHAFEDIRGRYGDVDYHDLMVFTDWCVQNLHFIDASRFGVTGGSYGGYMTNWIVTRTDRFKAAVSQRSISNWVSKFGGCDIGYYYVEDQHLGTPWRDVENLWRESPLPCVDRVKTPVLFIHSTEDFRCELNQGFQMFTALKVLGVESRMCVFRGENHELSRSGKPRNRLGRLRAITEWFDAHLKPRI
jgi:dipeptidyl aminopeptidase/acylaminoacyl peptidase